MTRVVSVVSMVRVAALLAGLILLGGSGAQAQQPSDPPGAARPAGHGYTHYIEFRVGQIGPYGHSYIAYGRLNARGQPAEFKYADRHPAGGYLSMAFGHLVPVPANTKWNPEVLKLSISSSFRRKLTAPEYQKLLAALRRAQADTRHWNALSNNCNHFVAELAQALGMKVPAGLQVSYAFIPSLRDMNQGPHTTQLAADRTQAAR